MTDPYRTRVELECPQCQHPLHVGTKHVHACLEGCGEWVDAVALVGRDLGRGWAGRGKPCVHCRELMDYVSWGWIVFELCPEHGAWVTAAQRDAFRSLVGISLDQVKPDEAHPTAPPKRTVDEIALDHLTALLASPRELARRILEIERSIAELRQRR